MARLPFAFLMLAACGGRDVTNPARGASRLSANSAAASPDESSARSGAFHATKECSKFHGLAGEFCTITSSTLAAIPAGSRITYASAAVNGFLDTDITLDPPKPGNNQAFGHCMVDLVTGQGLCTFAGGTGKFTSFQASEVVSPLGWPNFAWDGTYAYGK